MARHYDDSVNALQVTTSFKPTLRFPFVKSTGHKLTWPNEAARKSLMSDPASWQVFRRHEAMHILDGQKHPLISFLAQPRLGGRVSLPGGSVARAFLETRAFGIENGAFRLPRLLDVKSSIPNMVIAQDLFYTYLVLRGGTLVLGDE